MKIKFQIDGIKTSRMTGIDEKKFKSLKHNHLDSVFVSLKFVGSLRVLVNTLSPFIAYSDGSSTSPSIL